MNVGVVAVKGGKKDNETGTRPDVRNERGTVKDSDGLERRRIVVEVQALLALRTCLT